MKTLDMDKVRKFVEERKPQEVLAGILEDWFWTAATIYENGEWVIDNRAWVTSAWGTPGFKAEMENGDTIEIEAYMDETEDQANERRNRVEKNRIELKELSELIRKQNSSCTR